MTTGSVAIFSPRVTHPHLLPLQPSVRIRQSQSQEFPSPEQMLGTTLSTHPQVPPQTSRQRVSRSVSRWPTKHTMARRPPFSTDVLSRVLSLGTLFPAAPARRPL